MNSRKENILNRIADELTESDPWLVSWLSMFNQLSADEPVPEEPQTRRSPGRRRHGRQSLMRASPAGTGPMIAVTMTMAMVTAALAAVLLVLGVGSHAPTGAHQAAQCAQLWVTSCTAR